MLNKLHFDLAAGVRVFKFPKFGKHFVNIFRLNGFCLSYELLTFGGHNLFISQEVWESIILVQLRVQVGNIVMTSLTKPFKLLAFINHTIIIFSFEIFNTYFKIVFMLINFIISQVQFRVKQVSLCL